MDQKQIEAITKVIDTAGLNEQTLSSLRSKLPDVRFTQCDAEDMEDRQPYLTRPGYQVFLLSSDGHCLAVTQDVERAVGLVLAEE